MKRFNDTSLFKRTLIGMIILTIILSVVLYFVTRNNNGEVKSLILGAVSILVLEYYHIYTTLKMINNNSSKLKTFTICSYSFRFIFIILIIFLGYKFGGFDPVYIAFGVALYPTMNLISSLTIIKGD